MNSLKQLMQSTLVMPFKLSDMRGKERNPRSLVELSSIREVVLEGVQEVERIGWEDRA